jgi:hypothetical protein
LRINALLNLINMLLLKKKNLLTCYKKKWILWEWGVGIKYASYEFFR